MIFAVGVTFGSLDPHNRICFLYLKEINFI